MLIDSSFLDALASAEPAPGGGSAAAYAGAMAAALVAMAAKTTLGKKHYAALESRMQQIIGEAQAHRDALEQAVSRDASAYEAIIAALRLPKEARALPLEQATQHAAEVPLTTAETALLVIKLAVELAETGNRNAMSDACAAAALANSALFASLLNVKVNTKSLTDQDAAEALFKRAMQLEAQAQPLMDRVQRIIRERGGV